MASPNAIDLNTLLAPVSEEDPAGKDAREDASPQSVYHTLKRERASARAAERKSVHDGNSNEADEHWREVLSLAPQLLTEQSKDLEVACWYTEALVRKHGFQGLRDAFALVHGLVERFWDNLYPMPDEDGIETRVAPLSGLNGEGAEGVLVAPIRKIPLTQGQPPAPFSLWQYQQALDIQKLTDEEARQAKEAKLGFGLNDIERAVSESSDEYFTHQIEDLDQAIENFRACHQLLDQHCGMNDSPPSRNIIDVMEECRGAINHLGRDKFAAANHIEEIEAQEADESDFDSVPIKPRKTEMTREDAFRQLREISEFFRKTEPHSPVSYVLEKAVKWGNMRLNELIQELIPDSSSRAHYSELTGVEVEED